MNSQDAPSITGGWLGTYYYVGAHAWQPACRFEATFAPLRSDGRFSGTILDDGPLGIANASGTQTGRHVGFTKVYVAPGGGARGLAPIDYEGTLSEDGRSVSGTWRIESAPSGQSRRPEVHGTWEAHRRWAEAAEPEAHPEETSARLELVGSAAPASATREREMSS
jgi:hypothetical protein